MRDARGQLSLSLVEAGVGVVFILTVTLGFALGVPAPETARPQLDAYATDVATILANESPQHGDSTRLSEVTGSRVEFERERTALAARVDRILTDNLMYRLETPYGTIGYARPTTATTGGATVATPGGEVTIWVWYV